tara:strand:- start:2582 stop:2848 length:267 start_codon:yes stop_codon:yes gene_type:complete
MSHAHNTDILKRLARARGHLTSVVTMVEEGRDALTIAQQMQAVIKALEKTKQEMILHHIDHHLVEASDALPKDVRDRLAEFREISKYL